VSAEGPAIHADSREHPLEIRPKVFLVAQAVEGGSFEQKAHWVAIYASSETPERPVYITIYP
jgi:hypothetical protein